MKFNPTVIYVDGWIEEQIIVVISLPMCTDFSMAKCEDEPAIEPLLAVELTLGLALTMPDIIWGGKKSLLIRFSRISRS